MTVDDQFMLRLTCWRENRGGTPQPAAMQSIINVILNRAQKHNLSPYDICTERNQFTSITWKTDPQLAVWAPSHDPLWVQATNLVLQAEAGLLEDITGGSTLYYNPKGLGFYVSPQKYVLPDGSQVDFPSGWKNRSMVCYVKAIAGHLFFTEKLA